MGRVLKTVGFNEHRFRSVSAVYWSSDGNVPMLSRAAGECLCPTTDNIDAVVSWSQNGPSRPRTRLRSRVLCGLPARSRRRRR